MKNIMNDVQTLCVAICECLAKAADSLQKGMNVQQSIVDMAATMVVLVAKEKGIPYKRATVNGNTVSLDFGKPYEEAQKILFDVAEFCGINGTSLVKGVGLDLSRTYGGYVDIRQLSEEEKSAMMLAMGFRLCVDRE